MPLLDQPVRVWQYTRVPNSRGTGFVYTWAQLVEGWAELIDGGGAYSVQASGQYEVYQLTCIMRWTKALATASLATLALQIKAEPSDRATPVNSDGTQPDRGGAWVVIGRSILEQADRKRFVSLTLSNTRPVLF